MTTKAKRGAAHTKKRILIVEDHPAMVLGLRAIIADTPDLTVCGEADDAGPALTLAEAVAPDLVTVDLTLKLSHGLELIKNLRARLPAVRTLVISAWPEAEDAERCLRAGARGYLEKGAAPATVVAALRQVLAGQIYVSERGKARLLRQLTGHAAPAEGLHAQFGQLTDREFEVCELVGQGKTTGEIAEILQMAPHTVQNQYGPIRGKLRLEDMRQLDRLAWRWVEDRRERSSRVVI